MQILQNDISNSVGELQGGNDLYSIYRVSFPADVDGDDEEELMSSNNRRSSSNNNNAAVRLLNEFNNATGRNNNKQQNNSKQFTLQQIKQYMLRMCDRRSQQRYNSCTKYVGLDNLMFILQFGGPTEGQVRHIDNMIPNLQICLYMSSNCPTTIVYAMENDDSDDDGPSSNIVNSKLLLEHWEKHYNDSTGVPDLIQDILQSKGDMNLNSKWYTKFFTFWNTIDSHLNCFGKLYQSVSHQLSLRQTDPGTTLLAGGDEVHAGPPTMEPRMFAFAIGIPESSVADNSVADNNDDNDNGENAGEIQYSPVTLHIDFCCLLFGILDYEYNSDNEEMVREAKYFLLHNILLELIRDYPMKGYVHQITEDRSILVNWLGRILDSLLNDDHDNNAKICALVDEAVDSDSIFYNPEIIKRRLKKKKKKKRK